MDTSDDNTEGKCKVVVTVQYTSQYQPLPRPVYPSLIGWVPYQTELEFAYVTGGIGSLYRLKVTCK